MTAELVGVRAPAAHRVRSAPPAQPLRALPVPRSEPHPSTTEAPPPPLTQVHPAQGVLPLLLEAPAYRGRTHPAPRDDDAGPRRTATADLPDPAPLVAGVVTATIEVMAGSRPASQLLRVLSADVYATLQRRAAAASRQRHRAAPVRRAAVRRVRTTSPVDGVVEASVVVQEPRRVLAVAVRLEGLDGRWRVTALQVG